MKEITLRQYQQECVDIINNLESGSHLIVMATGLGKTACFSHIERKGRILILSHREELVHQPQKYYDCSFGVERAEESSNGEEVISASVQTLTHRLEKFSPTEFDTIITDEAHHAVAPSYRKIYDYFKPRLHLGFTATPNRADKNYLGDIYDDIIFKRNIKWGIDNGYLCDIECRRIDVGYDLSGVHTRLGDFALNELDSAINKGICNEAVAEVYNKYAKGPTLIFAASVDHANNISNLIPGSEVITATTQDRSEILEKFKNGDLDCIVNCMVLTEGTDLPNTETVMMCRPTKNISLYTQAVGRGTRNYPGKDKLNLIDCVGASALNICTAPQLFGIDPVVAEETNQCEGLLSDMEERINKVQRDWMLQKNFWKINSQLIDIFSGKGSKYNTHNINFIMLGNGDMSCSIGDRKTIIIKAEDMLGNTSFCVYSGKTMIYKKDNIKMQEALDVVYNNLSKNYITHKSLWDTDSVARWSNQRITNSQVKLILRLYTREELQKLKITTIYNISRYQASILINRKLSESIM